MNTIGDQQGPQEQSPWARPSVLLSGGFILLLVLAGIIVAILGGGGGHHHPRQTAQAPPATTTAPVTANTGGCSLPAGSQSIPSAAPPTGTRWTQVGSVEAPQDPGTLGPQHTRGPWNTCFARNPAGALLAAMNLWAEGTAVPPSQLFQKLAVGAPEELGNEEELDSGGPIQFAGYRYDSYTSSRAQVTVVLRGPQGKLIAVATPMTWSGGDWKYVFPTNGAPAMQAIPELSGYVEWSAFQ